MVSTRKTATLEERSIKTPKTKKRREGKPPKAKRPTGRRFEPETAADAEIDGLPHSVRQKDATREYSQSVSRGHSKAYTMRSIDSRMIIDELKEALEQKNKELSEMRRLMDDRNVSEGERRRTEDDHHEEGEGESVVRDRGVVRGGGYADDRGDRSGSQWNTYKNFRDCKPPSFKGGEDPLECMRWLRKMEQVYESGHFTEKDKVTFATRVLEGGAADWWENVSRAMTVDGRAAITWRDFSDRVSARFCTESAMQKMGRDFLDLEMGMMSVDKFNNLFLEKLQFARKYCPDEKSLVARYVEALPPEYRATVRSKPTLDAAMEEARVLEGDFKEKKKSDAVGSSKSKRKFDDLSSSSKNKKVARLETTTLDESWCSNCFNRHKGHCTAETKRCRNCNKTGHTYVNCKNPPLCYNCKETGHISRDCPKEKKGPSCDICGEVGHMRWECPKSKDGKKADAKKAKGRAFMMTAEETGIDSEEATEV